MKTHGSSEAPAVAKIGDTVKVHYTCKLEDGSVFATTDNKGPKEFSLGESPVIPGLQEAIVGMAAGEKKTVVLPPEKGYGPYHDEMTAAIERSMVPEDLVIEVGVALRVKHADGHESDAFVTKIDGDKLTLDGNHPLAGKTLMIDVEIVEVTPE